MVIKPGMQECSTPLQSSHVKQSEFQQVELIYEAEIDGEWGRGSELEAKIQTPSISCVEDRGRPKIHSSRDQVKWSTKLGGALN